MLFSSFIAEPKKTTYAGSDADEHIYYVLRQSVFTLIPKALLIIALLVAPFIFFPVLGTLKIGTQYLVSFTLNFIIVTFWYLVVFGIFFQFVLNWFFNVYIISNKKIVDVDVTGFLYKKISEAPIHNIEDVTSTVGGAAGIIFNIGNVYIQTAAEKTEFEFTAVDNPSKVRDIISDLVEDVKKGGPND